MGECGIVMNWCPYAYFKDILKIYNSVHIERSVEQIFHVICLSVFTSFSRTNVSHDKHLPHVQ